MCEDHEWDAEAVDWNSTHIHVEFYCGKCGSVFVSHAPINI